MGKQPVAADSAAAHADDLFRSRLENQIGANAKRWAAGDLSCG